MKHIANYNKEELKLKVRATDLRADVIKMIYLGKDGHVGPSITLAEIIACLYFKIMNIKPDNPDWEDRDRLVLSKGHACPVLYSALIRKGILSDDEIGTLRKINTRLQGHPDINKTPGIDTTSGSLGNGLSLGIGMALGAKIYHKKFKVYVIMGDGELNEGIVWEAAMTAAKYKLDNLIVFIDRNNYQSSGSTEEIMPIEPLIKKWEAFNWNVYEINGNSIKEILEVIDELENNQKPHIIIAHTIKGYGVSFMENNNKWHKCKISDLEFESAVMELEKQRQRIRKVMGDNE